MMILPPILVQIDWILIMQGKPSTIEPRRVQHAGAAKFWIVTADHN
jgi:hypothetical protein